MMLRNVFTKELRDRRISMIWWVVGMLALGAWLSVFYPILRDSDAMQEFLDEFPPELLAAFGMDPDTFLTGAGFLSAQMYSLIAPIIVVAFTIGVGVAATAREERDGTADMLLSMPITRRSVILQKAASLAVLSAVIAAALVVALAVMNPIADLGLTLEGLAAINIGLWLLGLVFGFSAMAIGSFTGSAVSAGAVAAMFAIVSWFVHAFAGLYDWLEWPSKLSPFSWYLHDMPLVNGFSSAHVWLVLVGLVLLAVTTALFVRRDISTERAVLPKRLSLPKRARVRSARATYLLRSVFGKSVWDRRRSIWAWAFGIGLLTFVTFAAWPALAEDADALAALIDSIPSELLALFGLTDAQALATPEGFVSSRTYGSVGPIAMIVFSLLAMTSLVAREESTGRLDMVLSTDQRRRTVIAEKSAAVFALVGVVVVVLIGIVLVGNAAYDTQMVVLNMFTASVGLGMLGLCFWGIALAMWAMLPGSGPAIGVTAAIVVVTYFLNGLGAVIDALEPFRYLSPFYWYLGDTVPLAKGVTWGYVALAVVAIAGTYVAMFRFRTRDLAV